MALDPGSLSAIECAVREPREKFYNLAVYRII
jgi:hypothetical protein